MSPIISETLKTIKERGQKAFIPYITAGDPNLAATKKFIQALSDGGADVIELGVPFSDPVADGPVNQRSSERALSSGTSLKKIVELVADVRQSGVRTPILLFSYLNPVYKMGFENFAIKAQAAGVNGILFVDLPPESSDLCVPTFHQHGLETIFLLSPTTEMERVRRINELSTGFVYYVSRTGVTGTSGQISESLDGELAKIRPLVNRPICVGFGISNGEQAARIAHISDGVIIGSAIVKIIEQANDIDECCHQLRHFSTQIKKAIA